MSKFFVQLGFVIIAITQTISSPVIHPRSGMFGNKFQGDIKLTDEQKNLIFDGIRPTTGWTETWFRWPKNAVGQVIMPYRIQASEGFLPHEISWMQMELRIIERETCIRFVQRTTEADFVEIINGDGCWSWLGRMGGRQELSMARNGCIWDGTMIHEAIHALGYDHMHNHIDRDRYVRILWENIWPGMASNFETVDPAWFDNFNTPYDLMSVMHYPRWAFSTNGQDTIRPHNLAYLDRIGSNFFSSGDAARLRNMYEC